MKKLWILLIVILIAMNLTGCMLPTRPRDVDNANPDIEVIEEPEEVIEEPEIEYIEVSASDLIKAYDENGVAADLEYKDKLLKVTGIIGSIDTDIMDDAYVTLEDSYNKYNWTSVQCYFNSDKLDELAKLKTGEEVTIIGTCTGSLFNVSLENCSIAE